MKYSDAFDEPIHFHDAPPKRKDYPWEDRNYGTPKFFKNEICGFYLTKIFDPSGTHLSNGRDFRSNEKTYAVRSYCLTEDGKSWQCNFGNSTDDFILFFGFRNRVQPKLEFCLEIPMEKFGNRDKIRILDDGGYHIKGYHEFCIDNEKFKKMQEFLDAIEKKDGSKIEELLQDYYRVDRFGNEINPIS